MGFATYIFMLYSFGDPEKALTSKYGVSSNDTISLSHPVLSF